MITLLKRKYSMIISVAVLVTLFGGLIYGLSRNMGYSQTLQKDVERIVLLDNFVVAQGYGLCGFQQNFIFSFTPKSSNFKVTDIWFSLIIASHTGQQACSVNITFNTYQAPSYNVTLIAVTSTSHSIITVTFIHVTDAEAYNHINEGINILTIDTIDTGGEPCMLFKLEMFIEYEYFR